MLDQANHSGSQLTSLSQAPPPPYSQPPHPHVSNFNPTDKLYPHEKSQGPPPPASLVQPSSAYPLQPHHLQATTRTLQFKYTDWMHSSLLLLDSASNNTPIFSAKLGFWRHHLELFSVSSHSKNPTSTSNNTMIGTSSTNCLTTRLSLTLHNTYSFKMSPAGFLGRKGHVWASSTRAGAQMRWKSKCHSADMLCLDENEVVVAKMWVGNWETSAKGGRIELVGDRWKGDGDGGERAFLEEIVLTGLGFAMYVMMMRAAAMGAPVA
ncbi:MAG: hypothetical protein Q9167_005630 [Letrouitia subvulpina]